MAASKHLGIRDAVAALLIEGTPLAGGRVLENRDVPLAKGVESQILVYRLQSDPERPFEHETAPIDWTTRLRLVIKARKGSSTAEAIADDLACSCYARVMADQTLGGLANFMDPGPFMWDQEEADTPVVVITWDLSVQHRTEANAIT